MPKPTTQNTFTTAVIIGQRNSCRTLERQLDLLSWRPITIGWILADDDSNDGDHPDDDGPVLGNIAELELIIARRLPSIALVTLPAPMKDLVAQIRTRLRRLGVADRFIATLEDQLAGVGPRTHLDINLAELINRPARHFDEQSVRSVITDRSVLITGAGGSIGSELSRIAARYEPAELLLVDRSENALFEIDRQIAASHPQLPRRALLHDVVDAEQTRRVVTELRPEIIFHAAAHKHVPMMEDHPWAALENNFYGTKSVADVADSIGVERFVMISTDKAVRPVSVMGATKRLAEMYVQHMNRRSRTQFSIVRFGNVLGSSGSVLDIWSRQIASGGPVTITHPDMTRYFMTIPEAAALVIQSAALADAPPRSTPGAEVFLLDMGDPVRIVDLAMRFITMHGLAPVLEGERDGAASASMRIVFTGARPGERLHEELVGEGEPISPSGHPDIFLWELPSPEDGFMLNVLKRLSSVSREDRPEAVAQLVRSLSRGAPEPVHA